MKTLASTYAVLLPLNQELTIFIRIEIVPGETPFLFSNRCHRALDSIIYSRDNLVTFRALGIQIPLRLTSKELHMINLEHFYDQKFNISPQSKQAQLEPLIIAHVNSEDHLNKADLLGAQPVSTNVEHFGPSSSSLPPANLCSVTAPEEHGSPGSDSHRTSDGLPGDQVLQVLAPGDSHHGHRCGERGTLPHVFRSEKRPLPAFAFSQRGDPNRVGCGPPIGIQERAGKVSLRQVELCLPGRLDHGARDPLTLRVQEPDGPSVAAGNSRAALSLPGREGFSRPHGGTSSQQGRLSRAHHSSRLRNHRSLGRMHSRNASRGFGTPEVERGRTPPDDPHALGGPVRVGNEVHGEQPTMEALSPRRVGPAASSRSFTSCGPVSSESLNFSRSDAHSRTITAGRSFHRHTPINGEGNDRLAGNPSSQNSSSAITQNPCPDGLDASVLRGLRLRAQSTGGPRRSLEPTSKPKLSRSTSSTGQASSEQRVWPDAQVSSQAHSGKSPPAAPMTVDGWQFANPMDSHGVSTKKPVEPDSTSPPKAKSRVTFVEPVPSSASSSSSIASAVPETSLAMQKGQVLMKIVENEKDATLQ